jgi:hypothetical protein
VGGNGLTDGLNRLRRNTDASILVLLRLATPALIRVTGTATVAKVLALLLGALDASWVVLLRADALVGLGVPPFMILSTTTPTFLDGGLEYLAATLITVLSHSLLGLTDEGEGLLLSTIGRSFLPHEAAHRASDEVVLFLLVLSHLSTERLRFRVRKKGDALAFLK